MATSMTLDQQTFFQWISDAKFKEAIGIENFQTYRKAMNERLHHFERKIQDLEEVNKQIMKRLEQVEDENRRLKGTAPGVNTPAWPIIGSTTEVKSGHPKDPVSFVPTSTSASTSTYQHKQENTASNSNNSLRISGLPELDTQNTVDTKQQVCDFIKNDMKLIVKSHNIISAYRIGLRKVDQEKPRTILVTFSNDWSKTEIYNERMSLRKIDHCKVFINENLSKDKNNLLIYARKLKKEGKLHTAFSRDCEIYVKMSPDSEVVHVSKTEDVDRLIQPAKISKPEDCKLIQPTIDLSSSKPDDWQFESSKSVKSNNSKGSQDKVPKFYLGLSRDRISSTTMNTAIHESSLMSQESEEALFSNSINIS